MRGLGELSGGILGEQGGVPEEEIDPRPSVNQEKEMKDPEERDGLSDGSLLPTESLLDLSFLTLMYERLRVTPRSRKRLLVFLSKMTVGLPGPAGLVSRLVSETNTSLSGLLFLLM